jgi:hypothetical protein
VPLVISRPLRALALIKHEDGADAQRKDRR